MPRNSAFHSMAFSTSASAAATSVFAYETQTLRYMEILKKIVQNASTDARLYDALQLAALKAKERKKEVTLESKQNLSAETIDDLKNSFALQKKKTTRFSVPSLEPNAIHKETQTIEVTNTVVAFEPELAEFGAEKTNVEPNYFHTNESIAYVQPEFENLTQVANDSHNVKQETECVNSDLNEIIPEMPPEIQLITSPVIFNEPFGCANDTKESSNDAKELATDDFKEPSVNDFKEPAANDPKEPATNDTNDPATNDFKEPSANESTFKKPAVNDTNEASANEAFANEASAKEASANDAKDPATKDAKEPATRPQRSRIPIYLKRKITPNPSAIQIDSLQNIPNVQKRKLQDIYESGQTVSILFGETYFTAKIGKAVPAGRRIHYISGHDEVAPDQEILSRIK